MSRSSPLDSVWLPRCGPVARRGRLLVLGGFCALWFGAVVVRLADLQIRQGRVFDERARSQHFAENRVWAERGAIYDRRGAPLAVSRPARLVVVDTAEVRDFEFTAARLADLLDMDPAVVASRLSGSGTRTVAKVADLGLIARLDEAKKEIPGLAHVAEKGAFDAEQRHLKREQELLDAAKAAFDEAEERFRRDRARLKPKSAEMLAAEKRWSEARNDYNAAVNRFEQQKRIFERESLRYYPKGATAAHVLGFVDAYHRGQGGVELAFDALLDGKPGRRRVHYKPAEKGRVEYDSALIERPIPGASLFLTIDESIQATAETELARAIERTRARRGSVVVMDPHNGDILALANWPTYDPNTTPKGESALAIRQSFATSQIYEPGSTFKIVAVAAALENGLTRPDEIVNCLGGSIAVPGGRIRDHKPFGDLTVAQIVANSSNVGVIRLAQRVGPELLFDYIRKFGFGEPTGVELPGETGGLLHPLGQWRGRSLPTISIGHEIAVTPLQVARAFAVVANGGYLVRPRIVDSIRRPDGAIERPAPEKPRRVLRADTAAQLRAMLEQTVSNGTAKAARVEGYRVAGKTGTAQVVEEGVRGYVKGRYVASFAGFAPVNDPSVVAVVVLDSPVGSYYGGQVAAPAAPAIFAHALRVRDVPPTEILAAQPAARPAPLRTASDVPAEEAETEPPPAGPSIAADGALLVTVGPPAAPEVDEPATAEAAPAAGGGVRLRPTGLAAPDFRGWTKREVNAATLRLGLRLETLGDGVAIGQSPRAGAPMRPGDTMRVIFGREVSEARPGR